MNAYFFDFFSMGGVKQGKRTVAERRAQMKQIKNHIHGETLESFFDGELGGEESLAVVEHTKRCPVCKKILRENKRMGRSLRELISSEIHRADLKKMEGVVLNRMMGHTPYRRINGLFNVPRKMWVRGSFILYSIAILISFINPSV